VAAPRPNRRGDYAQIWQPGFEWREYLDRQYDPRLLKSREGRRALGRLDPLAFALMYHRRWLTGDDGTITFAPLHAGSYEWFLTWPGYQGPMTNRHAWVAPRGAAKSTVHFRIAPIWSSCYGHKNYFAIFSRTTTLAQEHMAAIQTERRSNALLRYDFPEFCEPRLSGKRAEHDTLGEYLAENGAIISVKGMDSSVLGSSIDGRRANVIILDDVENSEANYSPYQAEQRKKTITGAIGFYNVNAIWSWVGTTTMYDGLTHQLVRSVSGAPQDVNAEELAWVREQRIHVHHYRPLIEDPETGELVSSWPAKWSTEYLKSIAHTRMFRMEMDNVPSLGDEGMWREQDFTYVTEATHTDRAALFIDPAVTATAESDYTGFAVTTYPRPTREQMTKNDPGHVEVLYVDRKKIIGQARRDFVMMLLNRFPQIKRICVEDNQGGALWLEVFENLPVEVELLHSSSAKEVRAAHALDKYQARPTQVRHLGRVEGGRVVSAFPQAEGTMMAFPMVAHDDDVDAVTLGVLYWLSPGEVRKPGAGTATGRVESESYA
jgi:hypothetical protein